MRTKKSAINMITAIISQFVVILLGFISRKVMIDSIGVEYLGINGLMNNILTILSLAESGIGVAMVYALYKPLAENNIQQIRALMNFYKNTYRLLAILTAVIGLSVLPFLDKLMKDNTIENSVVIYLLFLFSSVCSYLYSYKVSMNNADQNKYLATIFNTITQILVLVMKILILYLTKNYILFLCIDIGSTLIKNIIFSKVIDNKYPYLKDKSKVKLDEEIKKSLVTNIRSLFLGKIGYIISTSSDNLVISSFISVKTVGLYSNYTMLTSSVGGFVSTFISSVSASVGNLVAKESKEKVYEIFRITSLINFWLYGFSSICLFCLSEPFIALVFGEEYTMGKITLFFIICNFFLEGIIAPIDSIKSAAGLYYPDRYIPIVAAIVNMAISILLVRQVGIVGVFLGTIISTLGFSFWIKPIIVYKNIFKLSCKKYFIDMFIKIISIIFIGGLCLFLGELLFFEYNFANFVGRFFICMIVPNLIFFIATRKTKEFSYIYNFIKMLLKNINLKFTKKESIGI